uniref:Uncharacterized protein LOC101243083 n=1 Tax=Phallusia mammillata TaxID=59560 RepID=A0A6F9DJH0_9ASCI|nr:uncharacterized protein LOC101243083 [Phallusia mammillata]
MDNDQFFTALCIQTVVLCGLIYHEQQKNRRLWVREIFANRHRGQWHTLVPELERDPEFYFKYFRMDKADFEQLLHMVQSLIVKKHTNWRTPVSAGHRLAITLRYLASGNSFSDLAFQFRVSESLIGRIIPETCAAIWNILQPQVLVPPSSHNHWRDIAKEFERKWQFPMCIGSIDGKHVAIQKPAKQGSEFYNYKHYHSIVLMGVCDANYIFTMVDIGDSGHHSDGGIFANSSISKFLQEDSNIPPVCTLPLTSVEVPYCIVGDNAFPLKPWLLRPYPDRGLSDDKRIFNYRLSRARRCIENAFGILAQRWRVLRTSMVPNVDTAKQVVKATVVLHNWLQTKNITKPADKQKYITHHDVDHEVDGVIIEGNWRIDESDWESLEVPVSSRPSTFAGHIRDIFKDYFVSNQGKLPWQYTTISRGREMP